MAAATFAHATRAGLPRHCRGGSPGVRPVRFVPPPLPARSDSPRAHRPGRRSEHVYRLPQIHRPLPRRRAHDTPRATNDTDVLAIGAGPADTVATWGGKRAKHELHRLRLDRADSL